MSDSLGFVVLARRPGNIEPVSAVFPATSRGLEQAQNVVESCKSRLRIAKQGGSELLNVSVDPVEYVIGEISEWSGR